MQNALRLGSSEVEQVNCVVEACCSLLELEARLERGGEELTQLAQTMNLDVATAKEVAPGTAEAEYPGFPADRCPAEAPELSRHQSLMAEILTADASIYRELKAGLRRALRPCWSHVDAIFISFSSSFHLFLSILCCRKGPADAPGRVLGKVHQAGCGHGRP